MTAKEINAILDKYFEVNCPEHRDAPMPTFDPKKINESEFADELRFKNVEHYKAIKKDKWCFYWESQEFTDAPEDIEGFVDEIRRWATTVGLAGTECHIILESRDGDPIYNEYEIL